MFNFNAYCFCPDMIEEKLDNALFFNTKILHATINSNHHLLLDRNEELWLEYMERVQDNVNAFRNLETWELLLREFPNKTLLSDIDEGNPVNCENISVNAPATCHRYIVTNDNSRYSSSISRLRSHGVSLLCESNLIESSNYINASVTYNPSSFYEHLISALTYVACSRASRLENEHNDHLRDLLDFKGYDVYDQRRMGLSATRASVGSLDLTIKSNDQWVTIIEPVRLSSIDTSNIITHYNKLIDNYNPLHLAYTHLVVYYTGDASGFDDFFRRYRNKVSSLTSNNFDSTLVLNTIRDNDTGYANIRSFTQSGTIEGDTFHCSHTCVNFS
ncbi:TPA: hypothetical protein ACN30N_003443 [Vibrio campbellii]